MGIYEGATHHHQHVPAAQTDQQASFYCHIHPDSLSSLIKTFPLPYEDQPRRRHYGRHHRLRYGHSNTSNGFEVVTVGDGANQLFGEPVLPPDFTFVATSLAFIIGFARGSGSILHTMR